LDVVLNEEKLALKNVVKLTIFVRNIRYKKIVDETVSKRFDKSSMPVANILEMNRFEDDHDVTIDCVAASNDIEVTYYSDDSYAPFSGAVKYGNYVSCSTVVPEATSLTYNDELFKEEVKESFNEINRLLNLAGASLDNLFRTRVYVRNMLDRVLVNEVTKGILDPYPLRVITEVPRLPNEQRLAIEAEAYIGNSLERLKTEKGQLPTGPFVQGIRIDDRYIYCAGVRPIDPVSKRLIDGSIKDRIVRCMENLQAVLNVGGSSLEHVFESRIYLRNMADLPLVEEVFKEYFKAERYPIWTAVEITRLNEDYEKGWDPNHDVEIEVSAYE